MEVTTTTMGIAQKLLNTATPVSPDDILSKKDFSSHFWRDIFLEANQKKASDIHIQQFSDHLKIRLRLNGELVVVRDFFEDKLTRNTLINRIKQICNLDISSNDIAQDQSTYINITRSRYRIALTPTVFGENLVLRVIRDSEMPQLEKSGIRNHVLDDLKLALNQKQGFICITGPTGSGKSTTLQAALLSIDCQKHHVITIEDPVERILPHITQEQITHKFSWEKAIKMALRQDPDVILIGEIRDKESASLALEAAQTGHLVLSTLHTNDVAGIVDRLIGLGVDRKLIADNLLFISAQRLIPVLCDHCKILDPIRGYTRGEGCNVCSDKTKGLTGRRPIVEYAIRPSPELIHNFDKKVFTNQALKTSLYNECKYLVDNGITDFKELSGWETIQ